MKARIRQIETTDEMHNIFNGIDDYCFGLYNNIPKPCLRGTVGRFQNNSDSEINIDLIIANEYMQENNITGLHFFEDPDDVKNSQIVMDTEYFEKFRDNFVWVCAFWHELGHFHTKRYFNFKRDKKGSAMEIRGKYIERGEIFPEEKAADLFALYYTSKEKMAIHFDLSIAEHLDDEGEVIPWHEMIVEELWLRKEYIKSVGDSKEDILKELCKVCGVKYYPIKKR